jgi:HSP20 family protein
MRNKNYENPLFPGNWTSGNWSTENPFTKDYVVNAWNTAPFTNNPAYATMTTYVNNVPTTPATNAYETAESYVFEIAAPGYDKESFEVSYSNNNSLYNTLSVRVNNRAENREYTYREFNYGSFTREFNIPTNADTTETRAKYDNGVLTILIPKTDTPSNWKTIKVS